MLTTIALLAGSFALLMVGALIFTNAIEWAGVRLNLGHGAVGSILAAVATALPESMIPVIAIIFGSKRGEIAIGAIIGAPFLLGTLALALVGLSAVLFRKRRQGIALNVTRRTVRRDLVVFILAFTPAVIVGLTESRALHIGAAVLLIAAYGVYVWRTIATERSQGDAAPESPLLFDPTKRDPPSGWQIIAQNAVGLIMIVGGAQLFVTTVEHLGEELGVAALVLALLLAPLASELPEKMNSVLWIRDAKDTLALGNITGAMVFQSTLPVSVGLLFTDWKLSAPALAASAAAVGGAALAIVAIGRGARFPLYGFIWAGLYLGCAAYILTTR